MPLRYRRIAGTDPAAFAELQELVLRYSPRVSGCILVLLEWDGLRQRLVRELRARAIPVWALVVAPAGEAHLPVTPSPADQPERLLVLEAGRVAEGLSRL